MDFNIIQNEIQSLDVKDGATGLTAIEISANQVGKSLKLILNHQTYFRLVWNNQAH